MAKLCHSQFGLKDAFSFCAMFGALLALGRLAWTSELPEVKGLAYIAGLLLVAFIFAPLLGHWVTKFTDTAILGFATACLLIAGYLFFGFCCYISFALSGW